MAKKYEIHTAIGGWVDKEFKNLEEAKEFVIKKIGKVKWIRKSSSVLVFQKFDTGFELGEIHERN